MKRTLMWILYFTMTLAAVWSLLFFQPGVWICLALFLVWGIFSLRNTRLDAQRCKTLEQALAKFGTLLPGTEEGKSREGMEPAELHARIRDEFGRLMGEKAALQDRVQELQDKVEEYRNLKETMDELCSVHLPVDIGPRWDALIDQEWGQVNKEALEHLNTIKLMNDQNLEFISAVINEFGEQQKTFSSFSQKYRMNMEEYSIKAESAKKAVLNELGQSSKKIEETFAQFSQVEDITEKIKMISLNLSIEASKVRGSESFSFLARELRRLAQSTEETTKGISISIKNTVDSMKQSREEQVQDLSTMDGILKELEGLLREYDDASGKLNSYMRKAIDRINVNQEEQKAILLNFFKTLQQVAITKGELEHQIQYYGIFLKKTDEFVQKALRNEKECPGPSCPQRRIMLEELGNIANTDAERRMVNDLFKELLGEDREALHGTLAVDSSDYISF